MHISVGEAIASIRVADQPREDVAARAGRKVQQHRRGNRQHQRRRVAQRLKQAAVNLRGGELRLCGRTWIGGAFRRATRWRFHQQHNRHKHQAQNEMRVSDSWFRATCAVKVDKPESRLDTY